MAPQPLRTSVSSKMAPHQQAAVVQDQAFTLAVVELVSFASKFNEIIRYNSQEQISLDRGGATIGAVGGGSCIPPVFKF